MTFSWLWGKCFQKQDTNRFGYEVPLFSEQGAPARLRTILLSLQSAGIYPCMILTGVRQPFWRVGMAFFKMLFSLHECSPKWAFLYKREERLT